MLTNKLTKMHPNQNAKPLFVIYKTYLGSTSLGVLTEENSVFKRGSIVTISMPINDISAGNPTKFIRNL